MIRCLHAATCALVLAQLSACESAPPSAPLLPDDGPLLHESGSSMQEFRVRDDCEVTSFNAVLGAGTCIGDGGTTFEEFIEELAERQEVGSWDFNPEEAKIRAGTGLAIHNEGGEFHTVTRVAAFGGGIIPELNGLSGFSSVVPECGAEFDLAPPSSTNVFVDAGMKATMSSGVLPAGKHRLQCCIHPWMKSTITVR